jgi:hypothetical protein
MLPDLKSVGKKVFKIEQQISQLSRKEPKNRLEAKKIAEQISALERINYKLHLEYEQLIKKEKELLDDKVRSLNITAGKKIRKVIVTRDKKRYERQNKILFKQLCDIAKIKPFILKEDVYLLKYLRSEYSRYVRSEYSRYVKLKNKTFKSLTKSDAQQIIKAARKRAEKNDLSDLKDLKKI